MDTFDSVQTTRSRSTTLFCDEGVFRIVLDIYLQKKDEYCNIILMLGGFHIAKFVEHCIGKYIQESCLEESLRQT